MENEISFCLLKRKRKMEVRFPWSANDQRYSTIAVSANVPIYGTERDGQRYKTVGKGEKKERQKAKKFVTKNSCLDDFSSIVFRSFFV